MKVITRFLFLFLIFYLLSISDVESIFNNPHISNRKSNPIDNKIIILTNSISLELSSQTSSSSCSNAGNQKKSQSSEDTSEFHSKSNFNILQRYNKFNHNSYILSPNFFAISDKYLIIKNVLYKINEVNKRLYQIKHFLDLGFIFLDYLDENLSKNMEAQTENLRHKEIIIYGNKNN